MIRPLSGSDRRGFTLIELMIVVAIIGILSAIAVQQFSAYRLRAHNTASRSDLKNVYTTAQAYFNDHQGGVFDSAALATSGFQPSRGVVLTIVNGTPSGLQVMASNQDAGTGAVIYTLSAGGGISP